MKLKFRAWDGQKMVVPDWITLPPVGYWHEYSDKTLSFDELKHSDKIMLCTPFKDKNEMDIYEGDIISFTSVYDATQKKEYEVFFDEKCGSWWCKNGYELCNVITEQHDDNWKKSQNFKIKENQYIEIIGNIYERRAATYRP